MHIFQETNSRSTMSKMSTVKEVNAATAFSMIKKGALLVDVRETREIDRKAFGVSDYLSVPMSRFQSSLQEIPAERKVILACHSGSRSGMASRILVNSGHRKVHNLQHGIISWERNGLPVTKQESPSPLTMLFKMFRKEA
ncbi:rhodanese-like domain-containing protein [Chlorobaculum sp. 24CR]|nr:rhodanese-like domain-containing protein [Chlorobaculum sp. 24CR]